MKQPLTTLGNEGRESGELQEDGELRCGTGPELSELLGHSERLVFKS